VKAFPQTESTMHIDLPIETQQGMDLRDYFASKALQAIIQTYKGEDTESACITAYEYADTMMKVRNGTNPTN
jgi:RNA polymerase-interacting CarD/CdnL/TRCF family regulator